MIVITLPGAPGPGRDSNRKDVRQYDARERGRNVLANRGGIMRIWYVWRQ